MLCLNPSRVGGKKDSVHRCRSCSGSGVTVQFRQLGPGMVQQMQSKCSDCNGEGETCREKDRCKTCKGQKFVDEEKKLEVRISQSRVCESELIFT